jgi:hypothetical protein
MRKSLAGHDQDLQDKAGAQSRETEAGKRERGSRERGSQAGRASTRAELAAPVTRTELTVPVPGAKLAMQYQGGITAGTPRSLGIQSGRQEYLSRSDARRTYRASVRRRGVWIPRFDPCDFDPFAALTPCCVSHKGDNLRADPPSKVSNSSKEAGTQWPTALRRTPHLGSLATTGSDPNPPER